MEALPATDCAQWKSTVDPDGARDCSGAIATLADFPVLDATVQRVIALCDDDHATTADLVDALELDPSFSANLLRFANSAAQAHPIRAKSVRQAVMLVGRVNLRRLAIEAATFRFLERARGNGGAACGDLHMHAVAVATCAMVAATRVGVRGEAVHVGALLHDVGNLVLPAAFGAADCDAIAAEHPGGAERVRVERERFGIDHAQAGALLCLLSKRCEGSVILLDVDGLAAVNAAHGTRVGDFVLTQLARAVTPHGVAGRLGGDEIALFAELPAADADELGASICRHVSAGFAQLEGAPVRVSAGIASAPQQAGEVVALLAAAEDALRAAKREPHAA